MNDENLNLQIKAFCEKINNVLQIKRNFVKKVGIIDDKDISDIDDKTQRGIKMVNYSKKHNDINSFPDGMPGEIVLNLGCRMRIIYNTDDDTVDFWILDIFQEEPWRLYVHKEIKVDKGVNEDDIKDIITAMRQENAGQQSLEKRVIKLRNVVTNDPFIRSHIIKYKAQVEALKKKEQKLLSLFNKKIKTQNENTKKYFERWQNNTCQMSNNEICGIDCGYLKCNGKWCGCF